MTLSYCKECIQMTNHENGRCLKCDTSTVIHGSLFIKCLDCKIIAMNKDDSVCISCGSKNTDRLWEDDTVLTETYPTNNK